MAVGYAVTFRQKSDGQYVVGTGEVHRDRAKAMADLEAIPEGERSRWDVDVEEYDVADPGVDNLIAAVKGLGEEDGRRFWEVIFRTSFAELPGFAGVLAGRGHLATVTVGVEASGNLVEMARAR
jgi:hypothetical protein